MLAALGYRLDVINRYLFLATAQTAIAIAIAYRLPLLRRQIALLFPSAATVIDHCFLVILAFSEIRIAAPSVAVSSIILFLMRYTVFRVGIALFGALATLGLLLRLFTILIMARFAPTFMAVAISLIRCKLLN